MRIVIAILILTSSFALAEEETKTVILDSNAHLRSSFDYVPNDYKIGRTAILNFEPLIANPYEARMGFIGQPSEERLRMDIGASFDLFKLSKQGTFGFDMMTYTRLRSEGRFKFPVETTDYYFGVNSAFTFEDKPIFGNLYSGTEQLRLRLAHISSHLIDGYTADNEFISPPFVYSREILEIIYRVNTYSTGSHRKVSPYFGGSYIFSKIPKEIESFELISGFEYREGLTENMSIEAGYNFTLKGFDNTFYGVNSGQAGIVYNFSENRAIFIGVYLYDGLSMHGMFFNQKDSYIGIGTQIYYF